MIFAKFNMLSISIVHDVLIFDKYHCYGKNFVVKIANNLKQPLQRFILYFLLKEWYLPKKNDADY